jgi:hypothetical protein
MVYTGPITKDNTIREWFAHPDGGLALREMLENAGQDMTALDPIDSMPLKSLVTMSEGKISDEDIDTLVRTANDGMIPEEV